MNHNDQQLQVLSTNQTNYVYDLNLELSAILNNYINMINLLKFLLPYQDCFDGCIGDKCKNDPLHNPRLFVPKYRKNEDIKDNSQTTSQNICTDDCNDSCKNNVLHNSKLFIPKNYKIEEKKEDILEDKDDTIDNNDTIDGIPNNVRLYFEENGKLARQYFNIIPYQDDWSNYNQFGINDNCIGCMKYFGYNKGNCRMKSGKCNILLHKNPRIFYQIDFTKIEKDKLKDLFSYVMLNHVADIVSIVMKCKLIIRWEEIKDVLFVLLMVMLNVVNVIILW